MYRPYNSRWSYGRCASDFTRRSYSKSFCPVHASEHRQMLEKELYEIIQDRDNFERHITRQNVEQYHQELSNTVDKWERQSIDKIGQTADDIRWQLTTITQKYHHNIKENLTQLTQQLNQARCDGNFFEYQLKQWRARIQELRRMSDEQDNIQLSQIDVGCPFIPKLSLVGKTTGRITPFIPNYKYKYEKNESQSDIGLIFRWPSRYSSGYHTLCFKIECDTSNSTVLMGIISQRTSASTDPYKNPTFCGWSTNNLVYLHGVPYSNFNNYRTNIKDGDIFQLTIDCDQTFICLTNERTCQTYELTVNTARCPLPWQPHVRILTDSY
ncbi:unnamed protein product [Rotaria sordida]|uniref:Uncharacterized protein n=1 Tax=Rotaria sordida TaxID=392033 RepID=A0A819SEI7_9BILA|nr:unnamed protein product [Rotaria sordida]CAF4058115.1 unnamed protein product [Rotaria sordida]